MYLGDLYRLHFIRPTQRWMSQFAQKYFYLQNRTKRAVPIGHGGPMLSRDAPDGFISWLFDIQAGAQFVLLSCKQETFVWSILIEFVKYLSLVS
jgi:hypothetical protein